MGNKEFNLSEKIYYCGDCGRNITADKVKEFIRLLKERKHYSSQGDYIDVKDLDKLAGDVLK